MMNTVTQWTVWLLLVSTWASAFAAERAPAEVEVWLGHIHPERLTTEGHAWPFVRSHLAAAQLAINAVAFLTKQEDLAAFAAELKAHGISVAVECGYFDWESTRTDFRDPNPKRISDRVRARVEPGVGTLTARTEMAKLANLIATYGAPDYLVLDGPLRRLVHPGADTGRGPYHGEQQGLSDFAAAAVEVAAYMRTWRAEHPHVQFVILTNFPNWGWKGDVAYWASGPDGMYWGDYHVALTTLLDHLESEGLRPNAVRADNPYEYSRGSMPIPQPHYPPPMRDPDQTDWLARLLDLERYVTARGYPFDLIVNSQQGGHTSGAAFEAHTLEYIRWYRQAGGRPGRFVVQTWYRYPEQLAPENQPGTLTHTLKQVLLELKTASR